MGPRACLLPLRDRRQCEFNAQVRRSVSLAVFSGLFFVVAFAVSTGTLFLRARLNSHSGSHSAELARSFLQLSHQSAAEVERAAALLRAQQTLSQAHVASKASERKLLVVHAYHGLSNRLRAVASAAALAEVSDRQLVVVWEPDVHVSARLHELFDVPKRLFVLDAFEEALLGGADTDAGNTVERGHNNAVGEWLRYNYMVEGGKNERLEDQVPKHIYVRSAFTLVSRTLVRWQAIDAALRDLRPIKEVRDAVARYEADFGAVAGDLVGVHVRMEANQSRDVPGIRSLGIHHAAGLAAMGDASMWRVRCHYRAFIPKLQSYVARHPSTRFLVATDSPEAIAAISDALGAERVLHTDMHEHVRCAGAEGRLLACQRFALTELHLLSKCRHLYVSKWSSYSEIAARLADLNSITGAVEQGCFTEEEMPDVMARAVAEAVQ